MAKNEAFEALKNQQTFIATRIDETVRVYNELKDIPTSSDDIILMTKFQVYTEKRENVIDLLRA